MSTTLHLNAGFDLDLRGMLPRPHTYALSLTRNSDRADDLVQQTALKALAGRESFHSGTNFAGWVFRIQRNEFISELRRARPTVDIDTPAVPALSHPPRQESGLILREFKSRISRARAALAALLDPPAAQPATVAHSHHD